MKFIEGNEKNEVEIQNIKESALFRFKDSEMMGLVNLNIKNHGTISKNLIEVESGSLDVKNCLIEGTTLIKNNSIFSISKSFISYCRIGLNFQHLSRGSVESCNFIEIFKTCILCEDESEISVESNVFTLGVEKETIGVHSQSLESIILSRNKFSGNGQNIKDETGSLMLIKYET